MKKTSIICVIMGIVCFALAGYIVYNKFFKEKDVVDFNKDDEIKLINEHFGPFLHTFVLGYLRNIT